MTALQRALLEAFFRRESRLFLTGGAALGGFHLMHRASDDLDLFALPSVPLDEAERALEGAARDCGAALISRSRLPEFRRYLAERGKDSTVVDLAVDRAPQVRPDKQSFGPIRVDPLEEIAANKICALLSRNEPKDLVDLKAILEAGVDLQRALEDAGSKDAGASAASLAYVLGQWTIGAAAVLPGGVDPVACEAFRRDLVVRLARLALPASGG